MDIIIERIFSNFDFGLMISIVLLTYGLLKCLNLIKNVYLSQVTKRIITFIISAILGVIYHEYINMPIDEIIPTYLISIVAYDYIIKKFLDKLKDN